MRFLIFIHCNGMKLFTGLLFIRLRIQSFISSASMDSRSDNSTAAVRIFHSHNIVWLGSKQRRRRGTKEGSQHCCAFLIIYWKWRWRGGRCVAQSFFLVGGIWQKSEYVVSWWNYLEFFHPPLSFFCRVFVGEVKVQVTCRIWMTSTFESDVMVN